MKTRIFTLLFVSLLLSGCFYTETTSTDLNHYNSAYPQDANHYQIQLLFGDFKGLSTETLQTNAIPLKLAVTALVMKRHHEKNLPLEFSTFTSALKEYGFMLPEKIENLDPKITPPNFTYPMGLIRGDLVITKPTKLQFEMGNVTCAVCHSGRTYDAQGFATNRAWLGLPNTSINLQGYTQEIYDSFKFIQNVKSEFFKNLKVIYPDIKDVEYKSISKFVYPEVSKQVAAFEAGSDTVLAFINGPAGMANAIGAFKRVFGIYKPGTFEPKERGSVNIPDMSYKAFKTNYTVDGIYTPSGITPNSVVTENDITVDRMKGIGTVAAIFPIPVQGVQADKTEVLIPTFEKIFEKFVQTYKAPRFPGKLDEAKALKGEQIYRNNCMKCHGEFSAGIKDTRLISYPNKKILASVIGTDTERLVSINAKLKKKLYESWVQNKIQVAFDQAYMAPVLAGVWATAPYLHNGSVPSLWAMMNPSERPDKFYVGGHKLDFTDVGISYPEGYVPFSTPTLVDTTETGNGLSNNGHEKPFEPLSVTEKRELIEYLKTL